MPGRVEQALCETDVGNTSEAVDAVNKAIGHLEVLKEMLKLDQLKDADTALGNAFSYLDSVQDMLESENEFGTKKEGE